MRILGRRKVAGSAGDSIPDFTGAGSGSQRSWRIGVLVVVGILVVPTLGLIGTTHLLRQADERRARSSNALAVAAVASEVGQAYQERLRVFRDLPRRPGITAGLSQHRLSTLVQSLGAALDDARYCRLVLRSPGIPPVSVVSGPATCWSPPPPTAHVPGLRPLGTHLVSRVAFTGFESTGAVPGYPATSLQVVFAISSLSTVPVAGSGMRATVVAGTTIVSSSSPSRIGATLASAASQALVRAGRPGTATAFSPVLHTNVILAYQPVPGTGLGVFFSVTAKVAYAAADHASRILLAGYLVVLAIVVGLATMVVLMLRRREVAREAAARHYRSLAEATPDGIAIVDEDGRLVYANPALVAMVGAGGPETWRGRSTTEWTGATEAESAAHRAWVIEHRTMRSVEIGFRHTDGHIIPVETNSGPFDLAGRPGVISVVRDLTQIRTTEAALAVSEARQRTTIETVAEGIVVYDFDDCGRHFPVSMNPAAVEISGTSLEESHRMSATRIGPPDLIDGDGRPTHLDDLPVAVVARTGRSATAVLGMRGAGEERIWLKTAANPVRDGHGRMIGIVASVVDVTADRAGRAEAEADRTRYATLALEARASERALRASEERFRMAFEHAPIGKALLSLDRRYEQVNQAMSRMTGYSETQLRALSAGEITHPDDIAADDLAVQRLLSGDVSSYSLEKRYLTATGGVAWANTSVALVRDEDGNPLHFIAQVQDITVRKSHDDVLADERRRLRAAQAIGRVGSWEWDVTTDTVTWSDNLFELWGVDRAAFDGDYAAARLCVHPDDRYKQEEATDACVRTGAPMRFRHRVIRPSDGIVRWFDARGEAIYQDGRLVRIAGALADVSEQVQAEADADEARIAAVEASRHKSAFLAAMSHEIRTPMNAVIGMTGLLLDTTLDDDQREFVDTVRSSGDSLLAIINDILDFSKIEAGGLQLERHPFDLRDCVESALDLVSAASDVKQLELIGHVDRRCPTTVVGDDTRLRQVLVNLLGNAVKFTSSGEVLLTVEPDGHDGRESALRVSVADTGIGIPADRLSSLFESFSQVDASTTRLYGGTGLGLAISQAIVKAMGGTLAVQSAPGVGTTFAFTIGLDRSVSDPEGAGPDSAAGLSGRSAVVVEDNATSCRILRSQLEGWGMAVVEVASGPAAIALLESGAGFDVAVVDMDRSETGGEAFVLAVGERAVGRRPPLVLLSRRDERGALGRRYASATVVTKPVHGSRLRHSLAEAVRAVASNRVPTAPVPSAPVAKRDPLRVLLAEDNAVNQRMGRLMLEKLGHRVDVVGNGREATQAVRLVPYDVVLMDVEMPVMDGLEATRLIRRDLPADRRPQIVALTASALVENRVACVGAGMDDYRVKPLRLRDLEIALGEAADRLQGRALVPDVPDVPEGHAARGPDGTPRA